MVQTERVTPPGVIDQSAVSQFPLSAKQLQILLARHRTLNRPLELGLVEVHLLPNLGGNLSVEFPRSVRPARSHHEALVDIQIGPHVVTARRVSCSGLRPVSVYMLNVSRSRMPQRCCSFPCLYSDL